MPKMLNFGLKLAPPGKSFGDQLANSAEGATPEASDRGAVRPEFAYFEVSIRNRFLEAFLRSKFNKK